MNIRKAELKDIDFMLETGTVVEGFEPVEGEVFWGQEQLKKWFSNEEDVNLVIELDGKLIGYILTIAHRPTGKVVIENLYVDKEYRNKGYAAELLNECLKKLKEKGNKFVSSFIEENNLPTIKLHEKLVFKKGKKFFWLNKNL